MEEFKKWPEHDLGAGPGAAHIRYCYHHIDALAQRVKDLEAENADLKRDHLSSRELCALNDKTLLLEEECRQWSRLHNAQYLPSETPSELAHRMREMENAEAQLRQLHAKQGGHL